MLSNTIEDEIDCSDYSSSANDDSNEQLAWSNKNSRKQVEDECHHSSVKQHTYRAAQVRLARVFYCWRCGYYSFDPKAFCQHENKYLEVEQVNLARRERSGSQVRSSPSQGVEDRYIGAMVFRRGQFWTCRIQYPSRHQLQANPSTNDCEIVKCHSLKLKKLKKRAKLKTNGLSLSSLLKEVRFLDRKFHCPVPDCNRSYRSINLMSGHLNSSHLKIKPHKCKLCPFASAWALELRKHKRAKHKTSIKISRRTGPADGNKEEEGKEGEHDTQLHNRRRRKSLSRLCKKGNTCYSKIKHLPKASNPENIYDFCDDESPEAIATPGTQSKIQPIRIAIKKKKVPEQRRSCDSSDKENQLESQLSHRVTCPRCNIAVPSSRALWDHYSKCHDQGLDDRLPYIQKCSNCNMFILTERELSVHLKTCRHQVPIVVENEKLPPLPVHCLVVNALDEIEIESNT